MQQADAGVVGIAARFVAELAMLRRWLLIGQQRLDTTVAAFDLVVVEPLDGAAEGVADGGADQAAIDLGEQPSLVELHTLAPEPLGEHLFFDKTLGHDQ